MSPDHITAGVYNRDIDKRLARIWSGYARLLLVMASPMCTEFFKNTADTNKNLQACRQVDIDWTLYPEVVQKVYCMRRQNINSYIKGIALFAACTI